MYDNTDTMAAASASPSEICSFRKDRPLAFRRQVAQSSAFEYQRMGRSGQRSCSVGGSAGSSLNGPTALYDLCPNGTFGFHWPTAPLDLRRFAKSLTGQLRPVDV